MLDFLRFGKARRAGHPKSADLLVSDWVVPVTQPLVWLFQPPRSGGTMLIRLFDGHPEVHVHPRAVHFPRTIGWPTDPMQHLDELRSAISMAKYNGVGDRKRASNLDQPTVPIYFDPGWFETILREYIARDSSARGTFNALFTGFFNSWRNYQNLYGDKRAVLVHSTPRQAHTFLGNSAFQGAYPDGTMVFIARNPADWIASLFKLESSRPFETPGEALAYYCEVFSRLSKQPGSAVVLEFDNLVRDSGHSIRRLCDRLGLDHHPALETTTMNRIPLPPNTSHDIGASHTPDTAVLGHGRAVREEMRSVPEFAQAERLFEEVAAEAVNKP